ncbi:growth/differentiation factor 5-like [Athalia rosae]|uniref:growth/differentiation factor 5-like n=1 Tax=Athalia rosae TaxID=37344 RepID=UPI002033BAE6|nr:growth/differentiation factor 5-like [Athalia rosae]
MWTSAQYWPMFALLLFGTCYLWRNTAPFSWSSTAVLARASFEVGLSLHTGSSLKISQRFVNRTIRAKHGMKNVVKSPNRKPISKYMLRLYHHRPDADIVRALQPVHVSRPLSNYAGRILEFSIPITRPGEIFETAELLGAAGMILRVHPVDVSHPVKNEVQRPRRDDAWRGFNVTGAVLGRIGDVVRLRVRGRIEGRHRGEGPILLLSYSKPKKRKTRSIVEEEQGEVTGQWKNDGGRRRRRNACRKRSLYVDFSTISYDEWVVAPKGYDAFQCVGKCFYPLSDHLSPTKHAIVQTLVYTALQAAEDANPNVNVNNGNGGNPNVNSNSKPVGRACCVPTRLSATSLLYMDATGTLTYQYGYEDMVVEECGCR